jgi:hypothetical protein
MADRHALTENREAAVGVQMLNLRQRRDVNPRDGGLEIRPAKPRNQNASVVQIIATDCCGERCGCIVGCWKCQCKHAPSEQTAANHQPPATATATAISTSTSTSTAIGDRPWAPWAVGVGVLHVVLCIEH